MTETLWTVLIIALALVACVALVTPVGPPAVQSAARRQRPRRRQEDFVMQVTYIGDDKDGASFMCTAIGEVAGATDAGEVSRRLILPLSSGVNVLPAESVKVTARPQNGALRPDRIVIGGDPGDWVVNDVEIGCQSQFSQSGDLPGEAFAYDAVDTFVSMSAVRTAMDFTVQVTYVGNKEGGAPFFGAVLGDAVGPHRTAAQS